MNPRPWYYLDAAHRQQGPVSADTLRTWVAEGRLGLDRLVWREGLDAWRPLDEFREELELSPPQAAPVAPARPAGPDVAQAGFIRRWAALVVDNLLLMTAYYGLAALVLLGVVGLRIDDPALFGALLLVVPGYYLVAGLYYSLQESSARQATLGKRVFGIKVTDMQGRRLRFTHALGRWVSASLSHLTSGIGFLMAAFTDRHQALHDLVAGTLVTDRWAFTDHPERQHRRPGAGAIILLGVLCLLVPVGSIIAAIAIPAYQQYVTRSQIAATVDAQHSLKLRIDKHLRLHGACPGNGADGFRHEGGYGNERIRGIWIGEFDDGTCGLSIELRGGQHDRSEVWLWRDEDGQWHCGSDIADRWLPSQCQG